MKNYKPYIEDSYKENNVAVDFFEHEQKSIMLVRLTGALPNGSAARMDCDYIKQQLSINLFAMRPISLLLDLSQLSYSFGNSFIDALSPLFELQIFESKFDIAFLLSGLNKDGLASLWALDLHQPPKNIFFSYEDALQYVEAVYDSI
jgi:hypothetical protein